MGPRGDAIAQLDWSVGQILATLDRLKLTRRHARAVHERQRPGASTTAIGIEAVEKLGDHTPAGPFRGGKYSNFEGGTRVPFVVRWPARVKPAVSDALVSQVDLLASFAALRRSIRAGRTELGGSASDGGQRERAAGAAGHVEDRARRRWSSRRASPGAQAGNVEVHRAEPGAARSSRTRTPSSATIREPQLYDLRRDPGERNEPRRARTRRRYASSSALLESIRGARAAAGRRPRARTSSSRSPTTGRSLTPAFTATGRSARRTSTASRAKARGSPTRSSRRRRARRHARRC